MTDFPEAMPYRQTAATARDRLRTATDRIVALIDSGAHDIDTARELTDLRSELRDAHDLLNAVLMRARARIAMDKHIIGQTPFAKLGEQMGVSTNTPSLWREEVGPRFYVLIWPDGNGGYVMAKEPPVRRSIARRTGSGAVVVPSRLRLDLLPEHELASLDLAALYQQFKDQVAYGGGEDRWVP